MKARFRRGEVVTFKRGDIVSRVVAVRGSRVRLQDLYLSRAFTPGPIDDEARRYRLATPQDHERAKRVAAWFS